MIEEEIILDENIAWSGDELKKAQSDIKLVDVYKKELEQMERDFVEQHQQYEREVESLKETQNQMIEVC